MLNTKYIIFEKEGVKEIYQNDNASGSAWFVKENIKVLNDDQEIKRLDSLNFRDVSVSQSFLNIFFNFSLINRFPNFPLLKTCFCAARSFC